MMNTGKGIYPILQFANKVHEVLVNSLKTWVWKHFGKSLLRWYKTSCCYCQTLGLVLRLRVDFVSPLSQQEEQEQEEQEEQEEQPLTKIYQKGVY